MKITIGIDPGLNGAISIFEDGELKLIEDTPTTVVDKAGKTKAGNSKKKREFIIQNMISILEKFKDHDVHAYIEKVHSMPGQGVASQFSFGYGFGLWIGILSALKIPYTQVSPVQWKKKLMNGMSKDKKASCIRAQEIFPKGEFFTQRGAAIDGRGDSTLIGYYGLSNY